MARSRGAQQRQRARCRPAACSPALTAHATQRRCPPHSSVLAIRHHARQLLLLLCTPLPLWVHCHLVDVCHRQLVLLACSATAGVWEWAGSRSASWV